MAVRLNYVWNKEWLDGERWAALEGVDFPSGEEVGFLLWLKQRAYEEGMFTAPFITYVNKETGRAVTFVMEEYRPSHDESEH